MSTDSQQLQSRIDDLEYKVAFQEETIDTLNHALSEQQLQLSKMQEQMQFIVGKLRSMSSSNMADESEETTPPHY
jgi:SlyX protein